MSGDHRRARGLGAGELDEAIAVADELIAAADAGDPHYSDPALLALRAWIRLARGDAAGGHLDSERAVGLARAWDLQAQSTAFCVRAALALAGGSRDEADELASELAAIGPVMVPGLNAPFPTLVDVAWVFRDLGRESEFSNAVLDATPIQSPWIDAARAIGDGDLLRAAEIIEEIGDGASAAYARLRSATALAGEGRLEGAETQLARAESFYREAGAPAYLQEAERLVVASGGRRQTSQNQ